MLQIFFSISALLIKSKVNHWANNAEIVSNFKINIKIDAVGKMRPTIRIFPILACVFISSSSIFAADKLAVIPIRLEKLSVPGDHEPKLAVITKNTADYLEKTTTVNLIDLSILPSIQSY